MNKYAKLFANGLVTENPLLVLMIGLCSSLAVTTQFVNGLGMGLAMTFVLVASEVIISAFHRLIPDSVRIPVFIIVIAAFTTIIDLLMQAYTPALSKAMGVFIPLIVVNCIIMGRVESFASKKPVSEAFFDGLGMGFGYLWVLCGISLVRELLGGGTFLGIPVIPESYTVGFFSRAPGGFFVFALFIAVTSAVRQARGSQHADAPAHCTEAADE
ncbi:electron transport complex subunit RsxE [Treponema endosymbiont of Eucomonympha sp.]|uniref:electron transport complex subunit RsxE n=1 Tax=Treponema endosymbiont of Eucomonympha sp. TaxID=1580831 RepID=UPI00078464AC|nr:electron transport complex subunit E [Treponema endosymbiont of Eucomonympha sp.]